MSKETSVEKIQISTDYIKLDSLLKFAGVTATGGEAKEIIGMGKVLVNGEVCQMRGKKLRPGDKAELPELSLTLEIE
ncbi:MAG: RNA-binding S4 domain-containing protein [Oscillospiraceae bacterium]|nr:RNA-binding S4 domain-containing protein [Oscillospiraceae bacterium]